MNFIPSQGARHRYRGIGWHVQLASAAIVPALPHIQAGALRALAVYSGSRVAALPDALLRGNGVSGCHPRLLWIYRSQGYAEEVIEKLYLATSEGR